MLDVVRESLVDARENFSSKECLLWKIVDLMMTTHKQQLHILQEFRNYEWL